MNPIYEKLEKCYQCVREKTDFVPEVAIILGSGFGQFADEFEEVKKISYHEIEGFPVSTVQGHAGEMCIRDRLWRFSIPVTFRICRKPLFY